MSKVLFVNNTIIMNATASRVWQVLTGPELSKEWIKQWWPEFDRLESDWRLGSTVLWRTLDGDVGAKGIVTEVKPFTSLKFTFKPHSNVSNMDKIAYELHEKGGFTTLHVSVGDFADSPLHEQCYKGAIESWDKSLPKIKELSEVSY